MNSVLVREEQYYTEKEICELLSIDKNSCDSLVVKLVNIGVLKRVSKEDTDKNSFEINENRMINDSSDLYKFTYVGIIVYKKWVIKCYPKYIRETDPNSISDKLRQVLHVIRKDKFYNMKLRRADDYSDGNSSIIGLMLFLIDDYFENGLYNNDSFVIEIDGSGEIDWDLTVNYINPIISDNAPYYVNVYTKKRKIDDYDYFRRLHECIISECSRKIEGLDLAELLGVSTVELSDDRIDDFGDLNYVLYRLNNEKNIQFNTRKQMLLTYMERYVLQEDLFEGRDSIELFGTKAFNMEANKRACFALVAATLVNRQQYNGVYDFHQSRHISVSTSNADTSTPNFYDHNRGAYVSGNSQSMYDYATSAHVSINMNGNIVDCYDYESSTYISFTVNGTSVGAYDYETGSHYNYNVN